MQSRYKDTTGKSVEVLEKEKASKARLQSQNKAQVEFNCELQDELAQLRAQLSMSQTTGERQSGKLASVEAARKQLEAALEAAEGKIREGEIVRRKMHNTILVSTTWSLEALIPGIPKALQWAIFACQINDIGGEDQWCLAAGILPQCPSCVHESLSPYLCGIVVLTVPE